MINQRDLRARAAEWALREDVVEKDYVLGWALAGIGTEAALAHRAPRRVSTVWQDLSPKPPKHQAQPPQ